MADEDYADFGYLEVIRGGAVETLVPSDYDVLTLSVGGNTAQAGFIVTINGEVYPACDLAITGDLQAYAIILGPVFPDDIANYLMTSTIVDGTKVRVLKINHRTMGVLVAVFLETTAGPLAVVPGQPLTIGTEAGKVRKHVYGDADQATDTLAEKVGTCAEADPGSAADDHIILMEV